MAVIIEASRYVTYRWDLAPKDFYRLADFSALMLLGMVAFRFIAHTGSMARWLPIGLFILLCGQCYSHEGGVDRGALFYTARKKEREQGFSQRRTIDVSFLYLAVVIFAASAANQRTPAFFGGMAIITGWALWSQRKRSRQWQFLLLFLAAVLVGYGASIGLNRLQIWLETGFIDWMVDQRQGIRNPSRSMTAIGEIGKLKQYNRIVFRVKPIGSFRAGQLLHEAGFNHYRNGIWVASRAKFKPLLSVDSQESDAWNLVRPSPEKGFSYEITTKLVDKTGILSLPYGCYQIQAQPVKKLERNQYGAFRVSMSPGLLMYRVRYHPSLRFKDKPGEKDLEIPLSERSPIFAQLKTLKLSSKSLKGRVDSIRGFFQSGFTYSLEQGPLLQDVSPLMHFLQTSRSGHCEFFATATVLMLRGAGIPARYASGYAIREYSRLEKCFVVRSRHAHAWALAYINGSWLPVDTTPSSWVQMEQEQSGVLTPVVDVFRWASFHIGPLLKHLQTRKLILWVLVILALLNGFLFIRFVRKKRTSKRLCNENEKGIDSETIHVASPYYMVQKKLIGAGYFKNQWEPPGEWFKRLSKSGMDVDMVTDLYEILQKHYRLRYHSNGLAPKAMRRLEILCQRMCSDIEVSVHVNAKKHK